MDKPMKRRLLFAERMLHGEGDLPFNAIIPIRIKGKFEEEHLLHALKKLQQKHPFLKANVEDDLTGMPWFVIQEHLEMAIPVRMVSRNSEVQWQEECTSEWATVFDTRKGPLMRVVWIKGEETSEMILVMHHCLCDGGSAMTILAELLLLIDNGSADIGTEHPILGVEDIIPPAVLKNRKKILKAKLAGRVASLVLWLVPVKKKLIAREKDYMINWKFDKNFSTQLIQASKAAGVTVNTVLCLAVLNAFKAVRKEHAHNKISCPVDIRKYAPKIKRDHLFAFGLMFVVSADQQLDFFDGAKKIQQEIDKKSRKLDPYETIMMMEEAHASLHNFTRFLKYGKSSNDCMFSNLGRITIPEKYQSFELETIFSPSVIGPLGNTTTLVASTFRDQMDFTLIASEGFIPYQQALQIKDAFIQILKKAVC